MGGAKKLAENWVHLGLGATAQPQIPFTGMEWYADYSQRTAGDGAEGRLVSMHRFTEDWDAWEMHPVGAEIVICTSGRMTVIQEDADGQTVAVELCPGDYAINEPGVWHTANVAESAEAIFITAGEGTEHRMRTD
ncbi:MAG: cupin domain-containing protein [Pontixanthobacter sp.]